MKLKELIEIGNKKGYLYESKLIFSDIYNIGINDLVNIMNDEVEQKIETEYLKKLEMLINGKPVQYIIGNVNFFGIKIKVNENVLIPRFETEELVENTINYIEKNFNSNDNLKVLDLCSGSGAIGLAIKNKFKNFEVDLLDISEEALNISKENSKNLKLDVNFIKNDLLKNLNKKYDIIISNPPYIMKDEEIEDIVKNNEPHLALYAGIDGLDCYRKILNDIKNNLNDKFLIAFEIGYSQKNKIIELINEKLNNVSITTKKDLSGNDRMIFVFKL